MKGLKKFLKKPLAAAIAVYAAAPLAAPLALAGCNGVLPKSITVKAPVEITAEAANIDFEFDLREYFSIEKVREAAGGIGDITVYDYREPGSDTQTYLIQYTADAVKPGVSVNGAEEAKVEVTGWFPAASTEDGVDGLDLSGLRDSLSDTISNSDDILFDGVELYLYVEEEGGAEIKSVTIDVFKKGDNTTPIASLGTLAKQDGALPVFGEDGVYREEIKPQYGPVSLDDVLNNTRNGELYLRYTVELHYSEAAKQEDSQEVSLTPDLFVKLPVRFRVKEMKSNDSDYIAGGGWAKLGLKGLFSGEGDLFGREEDGEDDLSEYIEMAESLELSLDFTNTLLDEMHAAVLETEKGIKTMRLTDKTLEVELIPKDVPNPFSPEQLTVFLEATENEPAASGKDGYRYSRLRLKSPPPADKDGKEVPWGLVQITKAHLVIKGLVDTVIDL